MKKATWFKKLMALALCLVMVLSMAACAQEAAPTTDTSEDTSSETETDTTTTPEGEDTSATEDEETVHLKWYVAGNGPQADTPAVLEEVNKYLLEKLNCTLEIVETDFGNYDQKMQMVISSQEEFDLCYTANWSNNFYSNVSRNAFLELDELVDTYAPELKADMPPAGWDAGRVNGKLYGIPNQQIWAMTNVIQLNKDVVEEYGFDTSTVKTLADLDPLFEQYKADHPETYPLALDSQGALAFSTFSMGYDELAGRHIPGAIMLEDGDLKVINQFELPQVKEFYELLYDWSQKGYIRPDASTVMDAKPDMKNGMHIAIFGGTYKPSSQEMNKMTYGCELVDVLLSDSWLPTSGITATMTAISRTSKHPEKAMEFINLLNTDKYLYNLITQGIEGKHYEKLDGDFIRPIEGSGYMPNADWMYGNQFLAYLKEGQGADDWDITKELNASAKPSPALGFVFDPVPVQNEIASVSAVVSEYESGLSTGVLNPDEALPEFLEKLDQAGADTIIAEVQSQLDAWAATK